ncbi:GntR family transcriptional regulator [Mesorhizobium sp.]|uniref:GntR family transcriptional regulator n=1 Tax=Mesorhizobium sp. TaxID=1871066 RepID=UPI000FE47161|nr:GntR family transcriptional regulator [Mesorhizobium sp.]RWK11053.1 MAG: GntR family transcriptional regulator [Mesorhizobium sp.]TIQ49650.1 MAG: GntR family transcriptional regulator [Mesorhizobium sp.]TIQ59347.1 MAG: GntR family transcriptional regulator [Mesorhizobium sp.]TJV93080.1 MAG: GntR family transcriptional regulator [Mesorhizobium sp.]
MDNQNTTQADGRSLVDLIAARIRDMLIAGEFAPDQKLSEHQVAAQFSISRNTLREVFRLLTSQRLLSYIPNRGVFVAAPDEAAVIDIYRVRLVIQKGAVQAATKGHPALTRMRLLSDKGLEVSRIGDWRKVGTINMEFHRAMVELCDSPRLSACFDPVLAELRLVFGQLEDVAHLHEPYLQMNASLISVLEQGDTPSAVSQLEAYLLKSEKGVLAALQRARK